MKNQGLFVHQWRLKKLKRRVRKTKNSKDEVEVEKEVYLGGNIVKFKYFSRYDGKNQGTFKEYSNSRSF